MSTAVTVYDWPSAIPVRSLFHAGGQAFEAGFTSGGVRVLSPEPGGRSWLEMEFDYQRQSKTDPLLSWLMSKVSNGNLFRVPLCATPQLVRTADLGLAQPPKGGIPWDNGQPWENGQGWAFEPVAEASAAAQEGGVVLTVNMGTLLPGLRHGHVIGHKDVAYLVEDITYSGAIATIRTDPPLRKDVAEGDFVTLRPKMTVSAVNPDDFRALYGPVGRLRPGSVRFAEAIL